MSLMLLGEANPELQKEIDGFLLRSPNPGSTEVSDFLKLYPSGDARNAAARALIVRGVRAGAVSAALSFLESSSHINFRRVSGLLTVLSAAASGFHGYRRNQSIGWGLTWFVLGGIFPVVTPVIAVAQGFGTRKGA